jgi:hypothetical protein
MTLFDQEQQQYLEDICTEVSKDYVKGARAPYLNAALRGQQLIRELPKQTDPEVALTYLNYIKNVISQKDNRYHFEICEGLDVLIEKCKHLTLNNAHRS